MATMLRLRHNLPPLRTSLNHFASFLRPTPTSCLTQKPPFCSSSPAILYPPSPAILYPSLSVFHPYSSSTEPPNPKDTKSSNPNDEVPPNGSSHTSQDPNTQAGATSSDAPPKSDKNSESSTKKDQKPTDASSSISQEEMSRFKVFLEKNPEYLAFFRQACDAYTYYQTGVAILREGSHIFDIFKRVKEEGFPTTVGGFIGLVQGKPKISLDERVMALQNEVRDGFQSMNIELDNLRTDMGNISQNVANESSCWIRGPPKPVDTFRSTPKDHGNNNGPPNGKKNVKQNDDNDESVVVPDPPVWSDWD